VPAFPVAGISLQDIDSHPNCVGQDLRGYGHIRAVQRRADARCPLMQRVRGYEGEKVGEAGGRAMAAD